MERSGSVVMSWQIVEHSWEDTSIRDGDVTICRLSIHDLGVKVTEDNQRELDAKVIGMAKLIAAAPNMLAALKSLQDILCDADGNACFQGSEGDLNVARDAFALIAKIEGRDNAS